MTDDLAHTRHPDPVADLIGSGAVAGPRKVAGPAACGSRAVPLVYRSHRELGDGLANLLRRFEGEPGP